MSSAWYTYLQYLGRAIPSVSTVLARVLNAGSQKAAFTVLASEGGEVGGPLVLDVPLDVPSGGTGRSALKNGSVLIGAGSSAVSLVAPGAAGNVLTSNGSIWTASPNSGFLWFVTTTSMAPTRVTANGFPPGATNIFNIEDNTAGAVDITVIGREVSSQNVAVWKMQGCILSRQSGVGSTLFSISAASPHTVIGTTTGWSVAVSADTTNGGLNVTVTGPSSTVHWAVGITSTDVS